MPVCLAGKQITFRFRGQLACFDPAGQIQRGFGVHNDGSARFFSFRRSAVNVKSPSDLITIPHLSDLEGQEFADAKARANAEHDQRPIS